jgi:hypothetical protein
MVKFVGYWIKVLGEKMIYGLWVRVHSGLWVLGY